ncbi:hypothetical protein [Candidatus Chlamydia corallus]|uniref:hypothetical protein n=1 Tax=Candidatus Chlamydia corallus TaxID=2038470 RepID=UPI000C2F885A|nr:hypothetical protein [Candidatus Chlamydia corallus]
MTLPINGQSYLQQRLEPKVFDSSRSLAMIATALVFFILALILSGLSLLPQVVLAFSGAYFIVGSFLAFIALGILLINCIVDLKQCITTSS